MTGTDVIVVNSMHVGEVEDTLYKCNALNGTNVGEVKDASMYVCMYVCTFSNSYRVTWPPVGGRGMGKIRGGVHRGGSGGAASAPSICQDHNNSTPHFHPHPTKTPTPEEQMEVEEAAKQKPMIEKPIHVTEGGKTLYYRCGNCDIVPKKSRVGMDSHIRVVHTKKALRCSFCTFSTYNFDSLQRHEKEHK